MKVCTSCGKQKPLSEFHTEPRGRYGRRSKCKKCFNASCTRWQKANPEKVRKRKRNLRLRCEYGITPEQFDIMSRKQGGRCAICGVEAKLCVDHCHGTGRVRGLLCANCNAGIGLLQDNPAVLQAAARYVTQN